MNIPENCKYTRTDEWVRLEGAEAVIGITDYAQEQLSDLVFIELPSVGAQIDVDKAFGVVESVKAASDLNMPIGGEVVAVNSDLEGAPDTINHDPYGKGWIIRIRPGNVADVNKLMDSAAYLAYCKERA